MKPNRQKSVAMIAVALLGGVAGLTGVALPSASAKDAACTVTVLVTKADGKLDPDVKPLSQACRPGEEDGGTELYNPSTGTYRYVSPGAVVHHGSDADPTPSPSSGSTPRTGGQGSGGTTGSGQTGTSATQQTTGGGSTAPKGPKSRQPTTQTAPSSPGAVK